MKAAIENPKSRFCGVTSVFIATFRGILAHIAPLPRNKSRLTFAFSFDTCREQAFAQVCALPSPFCVPMSEIAIFRMVFSASEFSWCESGR